jgi:hypothetical protein
VDHQRARLTGVTCGGCGNFTSGPHLAAQAGWPGVPDNDTIPDATEYEGAPYLIVSDAYVQGGQTDTAGAPYDFFLTLSSGASFAKRFTLVPQPQGPVLLSEVQGNVTAYQGVRRSGNLPNGGRRYGLMRIARLVNISVPAEIRRADSTGIGSFGILPTMFAWYIAVGVDPNDRDHLIAADVQNGVMKESVDGGASWIPMPQLDAAVTANGAFLPQLLQFPLAGSIAFDPFDSCHILVGTHQNGVIRSTDGGATWKRIQGSTAMTFVTSFYFPPTGRIWASTYGRGLWRLNLGRTQRTGRCQARRFPTFPLDTAILVEVGTGTVRPFRAPGEPAICPRCQYVVVRDGWITALRTSGDSVTEIAISGGSIAQLDANGREVPLAIPNVYLPGEGRRLGIAAIDRQARPPRRVRALVLEGASLRGAVLAADPLPLAPARVPTVTIESATEVAGLPVVRSGERVRVTGRGFLPTPNPGSPVTLRVGDSVVVRDVPVRADGTFTAEVVLRGVAGADVEVVAEQRDGARLTVERAVARVVPDDRGEGER